MDQFIKIVISIFAFIGCLFVGFKTGILNGGKEYVSKKVSDLSDRDLVNDTNKRLRRYKTNGKR